MKKNTFERIEKKYVLTKTAYENLQDLLDIYFREDLYPHSNIASVYFDTENYAVIRHSMEGSDFKEKIRLRKYLSENSESDMFIEIKRKVEGVGYKRRKSLNEENDLTRQIDEELDYAFQIEGALSPMCLVMYQRDAYVSKTDPNFRLTLDKNIKVRFDEVLDMTRSDGQSILGDEFVLMEVKSSFGYPDWFIRFLSDNLIFKTSFSKYARGYQKVIHQKGDLVYV